VTITAHDDAHNPVSGATVTGNWSGGFSGTSTCTTGSAGTCSVTSGNIPKPKPTETFSVTNLNHAGMTYASSLNHDPDGDSNGTSITVTRP
jgi:hypothetical protein